MGDVFKNRVDYLTGAIKVLDDLVENIPANLSGTEYNEFVDMFRGVMRKLAKKISDSV